MSPAKTISVFCALTLIWSSTWVMIKVGLDGAAPFSAAGLRFMIASFVILSILLYHRIPLPRTRNFALLSVFLGVFQMALPYGLVYWAEQFISSGLTALFFSTMPLFVALSARVFLGDPLTAPKLAGIFMGSFGIYVIFSDSVVIEGGQSVYGIIAALLASLLASITTVVIKRHSTTYHPLASISLPMLYAGIILCLAGAISERQSPLGWSALTWGTVVYLALVGSVAAFTLYFWLIKHIDVTVLSYQTFIIPILALLIGWIFLGETVTLNVAFGGIMVLTGIALAIVRRSPEKRARRVHT